MSAAFGMVKNPSAQAVRVIGAYSSYAKAVQLHEVVAKDGSMVMQQKAGGFAIPANGMLELKPGGNHLMFVGITKPITAGAQIPVTLITSDGGLLRVKVLAKVYNGANETYMSGM
jgi:copper(I)-binding protein